MFGKFGKYHPGQVALHPCVFDVVKALREDLALARETGHGAHPVEFTLDVPELLVKADREHWRYVIVNLLQNAFKYSPAGAPVQVTLETAPGAACVRISDQGIGVPDAELAELFSPFFRASNVGDRHGSGLGLAVVKDSARLLGARIAVDSREGRGTTFAVTLPLSV